ncbi:MAG: helix-turn-helix domain-containing protein [Candidatus Marinimicrobia bacterium]|nr:helix-turn-helix domain-containing protein [Candidatus Neomarinimicrobiota bacterium]
MSEALAIGTSPAQFYRLMDQINTTKSTNKMVNLLEVLGCEVEISVKGWRAKPDKVLKLILTMMTQTEVNSVTKTPSVERDYLRLEHAFSTAYRICVSSESENAKACYILATMKRLFFKEYLC